MPVNMIHAVQNAGPDTGRLKGLFPVEFYVETAGIPNMKVTDKKTGEELKVQLSVSPPVVYGSSVYRRICGLFPDQAVKLLQCHHM